MNQIADCFSLCNGQLRADDSDENGVNELVGNRVAPDVDHVQRLQDGVQSDIF